MSFARVVVEPGAKQDIRDARAYYADKGERVAADFRDELTRTFDFFSQYPEAVAISFGRTRLKPMRQFPYVIGYVYHAGVVHVTGVQFGALGWDAFQKRDF
ncbi:MAG: type II toxin-antitoxin system RelE/ParE family toxin [Planctomycetota bacterium]